MTTTTTCMIDAPTTCLIGGEWRAASDGAELDVCDPAGDQVVATVANASVDDGARAVDAAAAALPAWSATPPRQRSEILRRAFELMLQRQAEIAELITLENGKALADARGEVAYAAEFFRWYAEEAVRALGSIGRAPGGDKHIMVVRQPVGVAVLVTPWNFPAAMATRKIGPALGAGCTVVLKPAPDTPLTALLVAEILEEAGVPPGVVNVVPSDRSADVVQAMLADPRVRKLSFTGSTEVGRALLHEAADRVVNTSMELGGNAPFIVFDDADLDDAVDGAMIAKMRNGGEACTAANRFYAQRGIAADFAHRLAQRMADLRMGPGIEEGCELGPLVNAAAVESVDALVRSALEDGARAVTGGAPIEGPGNFYPATVLTQVRPGARILREEIFGPVAPVVTFDHEEEAVVMGNDTEHGLIAYVYTGDMARGLRVADALDAGMIGLNRGLVSDPAAPFGGMKQSGIGREGGHEGLLDYTETKYIATDW